MQFPRIPPHIINRGASLHFVNGEPRAKFKLFERVKKFGESEVRTVQHVFAFEGEEVIYELQLGAKVGSRVWARESELEKAP